MPRYVLDIGIQAPVLVHHQYTGKLACTRGGTNQVSAYAPIALWRRYGLVPGLDAAVVFGDLLRPGVTGAQALPYRRCRHAAGRELFRSIQEFTASDIAVNVTVE